MSASAIPERRRRVWQAHRVTRLRRALRYPRGVLFGGLRVYALASVVLPSSEESSSELRNRPFRPFVSRACLGPLRGLLPPSGGSRTRSSLSGGTGSNLDLLVALRGGTRSWCRRISRRSA